MLLRRDLTTAEKTWSGNYAVGEVVQFHRGSGKFGIPVNSYATVEAVDQEHNLLTMRTTERLVQYRPTQLRGVEVFRPEQRDFTEGDRVQFRAPFTAQKIANGALGRLEQIDETRGVTTIRMDNGKVFSAR